jgi:hypothetical protein
MYIYIYIQTKNIHVDDDMCQLHYILLLTLSIISIYFEILFNKFKTKI